jgi:hypothetical protein
MTLITRATGWRGREEQKILPYIATEREREREKVHHSTKLQAKPGFV